MSTDRGHWSIPKKMDMFMFTQGSKSFERTRTNEGWVGRGKPLRVTLSRRFLVRPPSQMRNIASDLG